MTGFRDDQLVDQDVQALESELEKVETQTIRFIGGSTQLVPGQTAALDSVAAGILHLIATAPSVGKEIRVEVIGHTDGDGSEESNLTLSQQRAEKMLSLLTTRGISATSLTAAGRGHQEPLRSEASEQDKEVNRRVSFRITMRDVAGSAGSHR